MILRLGARVGWFISAKSHPLDQENMCSEDADREDIRRSVAYTVRLIKDYLSHVNIRMQSFVLESF